MLSVRKLNLVKKLLVISESYALSVLIYDLIPTISGFQYMLNGFLLVFHPFFFVYVCLSKGRLIHTENHCLIKYQ